MHIIVEDGFLYITSYYLDELPDNAQPCDKCNHITTNINCILWQQQHQTTKSLTYPQETTTHKEITTYKITTAQRPHVNTDSVVYLGEISTVKTEAVIDIADTQLVVAVIVPGTCCLYSSINCYFYCVLYVKKSCR